MRWASERPVPCLAATASNVDAGPARPSRAETMSRSRPARTSRCSATCSTSGVERSYEMRPFALFPEPMPRGGLVSPGGAPTFPPRSLDILARVLCRRASRCLAACPLKPRSFRNERDFPRRSPTVAMPERARACQSINGTWARGVARNQSGNSVPSRMGRRSGSGPGLAGIGLGAGSGLCLAPGARGMAFACTSASRSDRTPVLPTFGKAIICPTVIPRRSPT